VRRSDGRIVMAKIDVPAEDLIPGPIGCRVQVVDYDASSGRYHGAHQLPAPGHREPAAWTAGAPASSTTTGLPRNGKPSEHMPKIAADVKATCGGKLAAVVATHRHADHISGFATNTASGGSGKVIAACKPAVVLQPWTEDPEAASDATTATKDSGQSPKHFVATLAAMHRIAGAMYSLAQAPPRSMAVGVAKQLRFLGMDNLANRSAVDNLIAMGARKGATPVFAHHGTDSHLEAILPGVTVHVLGPPNLEQSEKIRTMRSSDKNQFWQLLGGAQALQGMGVAAVADRSGNRRARTVPVEARWFRDRLASMSGDQLLEIVRVLDSEMNNTSLILLFEVGSKKLLFPGDAQIENWSYALEDAPGAAATRKLLAGVDLYKVGHHGSRNATPKKLLWDGFTKRSTAKGRLQTLLSTMPGKHGTPSQNTEVPRRTLLEALESETALTNTNDLKVGAKGDLYARVVVKL